MVSRQGLERELAVPARGEHRPRYQNNHDQRQPPAQQAPLLHRLRALDVIGHQRSITHYGSGIAGPVRAAVILIHRRPSARLDLTVI
jgi:hypothetical protein